MRSQSPPSLPRPLAPRRLLTQPVAAPAAAYCKFFESSAGGATAGSRQPQRLRIARGPMGYGMGIEDDGTVSGFTGVSGPAEVAGVQVGMRIVGINGVSTAGKAGAIAELQRCGTGEVEFVLEPPPGAQSSVSSTLGATVREIKEKNEAFARDTRGRLETQLIAEVLEPLDAYIERVDVHQQLVNERQAARETYDRYRAKVRDLGVAGSSKDPARLPRNEQKLARALEDYQRCNAAATAKLARFHADSVEFFGGLQRAYLKHQAAMFSAGHETFTQVTLHAAAAFAMILFARRNEFLLAAAQPTHG